MLGLSAPRSKSSLDEVLEIAEDVLRAFVFEYKKAALRDLAEISTSENKPFRE